MNKFKKLVAMSLSVLTLGSCLTFTPVNAHDIVGRFPEKDTEDSSGENKEASEESDEYWVDIKDDWRHGTSNKSDKGTSTGGKGTATGEYAVELNDGSYYWFHQSASNCDCKNSMSSDGSVNLNTVLWASNGTTFSSFGYAACAQYSLAMIASNLTGQCLPLDQSMLAFGDNFTEGMGTYDVAGTPSGSFYVAQTYCGTNSDVAPSIFADYWGLQCTESYHNEKSKEETKQMCDEVLDKGGMIWYRYGAGGDVGSGENGAWPQLTTDGHFICIRNRDEKGYYILDSCACFCQGQDRIDFANTPIPFDDLWYYGNCSKTSTNYGFTYVGFWVDDGAEANTNNQNKNNNKNKNTANSDDKCTWYSDCSNINKYSKTKDLGDGFYLYDGLPWSAAGDTYAVDTDTMLGDMYDMVTESAGGEKAFRGNDDAVSASQLLNSTTRMMGVDGKTLKGDEWKKGHGGQYAIVDGLQAVAVGTVPAVFDQKFCDNYNGESWKSEAVLSDSAYDFSKKKMAAALYERATGDIWFVPVTPGLPEQYNYPGGVAITGITNLKDDGTKLKTTVEDHKITKFSALVLNKDNCGNVKSSSTHSGDGKELLGLMNSTDVTGLSYWEKSSLLATFYNLPDNLAAILTSAGNYDLVGFVVWKK